MPSTNSKNHLKTNLPVVSKLSEQFQADLINDTSDVKNFDLAVIQSLAKFDLPIEKIIHIYVKVIEGNMQDLQNEEGNIVNVSRVIACIEALKAHGERSAPSVSILLELLHPEQKLNLLRELSFNALLKIAPDDPRIQPFLLDNLNSDNIETVKEITSYLSRQKSKASYSIPSLINLLSSQEHIDEACYAYQALGAITKDKFRFSYENAINRLPNITSLPPEESAAVFATLIDSGVASNPSHSLLIKLIDNEKKLYIRYAAILVIRASGQGNRADAIKALLRQSSSALANYTLRQAAYSVLSESITSKSLDVIPILINSLRSPYYAERRNAAWALAKLGKAASSAIPIVIDCMEDEMKTGDFAGMNTYSACISSLGVTTPDVSERIFKLMLPNSLFLHNEYEIAAFRSDWLQMLVSTGLPKDEKKRRFILSQILISLKDLDGEEFGSAAKAAGKMDENARQLVVPLTLILKLGERNGGIVQPKNTEHKEHNFHAFNWKNPSVISGFKEVTLSLSRFGSDANFAVPILQRYSEMPADAPLAPIRPDVRIALQKIAADKSKSPVKSDEITLKAKLKTLKVMDIRGKNVPLQNDQRQTLFFFADTTCPCVQAYMERLRGLELKYRSNVQLVVVFPNLQEGVSKLQNFSTEKKIPGSIIRDDKQQITKLFKAQRTAQAILVDKDGVVRYNGRIDDNTYNVKLVKDKALDNAIQSVLQGKNITKPGILPMSCELVY